ncbi:hypothetical protein KC352_g21824, partial [Hortaea werneckii]
IRDVCFRNLDKFANDGFFMTAIASFPDLQDFSAMLLRQVVREREELKRELEHKDTEIREAKDDRDATATHTQDVLATLIDVLRVLEKNYSLWLQTTALGRRGWSEDTSDAIQCHESNQPQFTLMQGEAPAAHSTSPLFCFSHIDAKLEELLPGKSDADIQPFLLFRPSPLDSTMANLYAQSLLSEVAELWRTGEGSDLTIKCEEREFKVHKLIVSAASPTLKAACQSGMLESQTGVIEHKTFDADTVERMLEYIYTRDYEIPGLPAVITGATRTSKLHIDAEEVAVFSSNAEWIAHIRMYAIGDYYQLPTLKDCALMGVQKAAADTLELRDFAYVVKEAHELIGMHETGFHRVVQDFCLEHVAFLMADKTFTAAIAEVPEMQEFATILLGRVTEDTMARARESKKATATLVKNLDRAQWCLENTKQSLDREREDHANVTAALRSQVDHYQAVIERLVDDLGKLPLRCPNFRCGGTNKAPLKLQRRAHADYGEGTGFVEIKCGRCRESFSKQDKRPER